MSTQSPDPIDALSSALSDAYSDNSVASTAKAHPKFRDGYKAGGSAIKSMEESQRNRREEYLKRQSESRRDTFNFARQLAHGEIDDDEDGEEECMDEGGSSNRRRKRRGDKNHQQKRRHPKPYKDRLMLSEWLVDIPDHTDLADWLMVACPVGKRCLVVAAQGWTSVYTKSGYKLGDYNTALPGGGQHSTAKNVYSMLDCVYSELDRKYYLLDVLCWNGQPMMDSETDFRFFWLASKLAEYPDLSEESDSNQLAFANLPYVQCVDKPTLHTFMHKEMPFSELDGLLFYYSPAHYHAGQTPLVGWLKPFMLPEILGVDVPSKYQLNAEKNTAEYIQEFNEQRLADGKAPHVPLKDQMTDD